MASLKSLVADGRFCFPFGWDSSLQNEVLETRQAFTRPVILVRAQSVWDDLVPQSEALNAAANAGWWERLTRQLPRVNPPYECMWLEALTEQGRVGALIQRIDDGDTVQQLYQVFFPDGDDLNPHTTYFQAKFLQERRDHGDVYAVGVAVAFLDQGGSSIAGWRVRAIPDEVQKAMDEGGKIRFDLALEMRTGWVFHTLARMNCANVKVLPIPGQGHYRGRHQRHRQPELSSVWHEIVITSVPKLRKQQAQAAPDGAHTEVRFHWVRGHYADYSKGAGLFGNPKLKAVFWIPEHRAGNEELGTVVPSYTIEGEK